jgi:hypothetical protein
MSEYVESLKLAFIYIFGLANVLLLATVIVDRLHHKRRD